MDWTEISDQQIIASPFSITKIGITMWKLSMAFTAKDGQKEEVPIFLDTDVEYLKKLAKQISASILETTSV